MNQPDPGLLKVLATNATGAGGAVIQSAQYLLGVRANMDNTTPAAVLGVVQFVAGPDGNVSPLVAISGDDGQDNVAPVVPDVIPFNLSRLTGFDPVGNNWDRLRVAPDDADAQAALTIGVLAAMARNQGWNGATWDRLRSLSAANLAAFTGVGGQVSAGPGEWAIQHTPAAATQATITRAAGGAGVRHVCRSITCSILAVAAQGQIILNLRDGGTGAGTILWSAQFSLSAGTSDRIALTGLNIVGSANTAMTLEVAAAPAATNFASVALTGYDVS